MDSTDFRRATETTTALAVYVDSVAEAAANERERGIVPDVFMAAAASALYLWLRNYVDFKRGLNEAELRQRMEQEVDDLVKQGYPRKEALNAVLAISKAVTLRMPSKAVVDAGLAILEGKSR